MLSNFDALIFDLDGTLWDTTSACAHGWNDVLNRRGIRFRTITVDDIRAVMGRSHEDCIRHTFDGLPEPVLQDLIVETAIEDNLAVRRYGAVVYDGVLEGLRDLVSRHRLFIVSNCQSGYIETFVDLFGLHGVFTDVECWGNTGRPKSENLSAIMRRNALKHSVLIGDAESDRQAARDCGISFYHATYGFGKAAECDRRIEKFSDLLSSTATGNAR